MCRSQSRVLAKNLYHATNILSALSIFTFAELHFVSETPNPAFRAAAGLYGHGVKVLIEEIVHIACNYIHVIHHWSLHLLHYIRSLGRRSLCLVPCACACCFRSLPAARSHCAKKVPYIPMHVVFTIPPTQIRLRSVTLSLLCLSPPLFPVYGRARSRYCSCRRSTSNRSSIRPGIHSFQIPRPKLYTRLRYFPRISSHIP
jgi:hypothetical protein